MACNANSSSRFTEREVSRVIGSIVLSLDYMHQKKLFHGNVRPHHILYANTEPNAKILLTNFGSARYWNNFSCATQNGEFVWDNLLDLRFLPPFLLHKSVQEAVHRKRWRRYRIPLSDPRQAIQIDVWALGVTMYVLLYAAFPFDGSTKQEIRRNVIQNPVSFPNRCSVSRAARDLLCRMLHKEVTEVMNMQEIAQHPWIKASVSSSCVWVFREIQQHCRFAEQYTAQIHHPNSEISHDLTAIEHCERTMTGNSEWNSNRYSASERRSSYVSTDGNPVDPGAALSTEGYMRQASDELEQLLDQRLSQQADEDQMEQMGQERARLLSLKRQFIGFIGASEALDAP